MQYCMICHGRSPGKLFLKAANSRSFVGVAKKAMVAKKNATRTIVRKKVTKGNKTIEGMAAMALTDSLII